MNWPVCKTTGLSAVELDEALNGVWLDSGELGALTGLNLHGEMNRIFTEPWQPRARRGERRQNLNRIYARCFGPTSDGIRRIRAWLASHPKRDRLISFLADDYPYAT